LLLDEPLSTLDSLNAGVFYAVLDELLISHRDDDQFLAGCLQDRIKHCTCTP
jgi:ABC-type molybdenum transport system ATPase subunit/photorepair protein PhrA